MKYFKLLFLLFIAITLTSCGNQEPEEVIHITNAIVNNDGHLIFTYSDESTSDQGKVIPDEGIHITNAIVNNEGHLIFTYSDASTSDQGKVIPDEDPIFYAVNFYDHLGSIIETQIVEKGDDASSISLSLPDNLNFESWSTDFVNIQTNMDIYPIVTEIEQLLTITLHNNEGADIEISNLHEGDRVVLPSPETPGKEFIGWCFNESLIGLHESSTIVLNENLDLYAKYEDTIYTVTFKSDDGTVIDIDEYLYEESIVLPEEPTKEDYFFNGWYYDQEEETPLNMSQSITSNITLYLSWIQFVFGYTSDPIDPLDSYYSVIRVVGDHNYVHVPSTYNTFEVTHINQTFYGYGAREIYLPETITYISMIAMAEMPNLTKVVLPTNVDFFGMAMFSNSTQLEDVQLPENLTILPGGTFSGTAITEIVLPDGLEEIGVNAFRYTNLTYVELPDSITLIDNGAFNSSPVDIDKIPSSLVVLGENAFYNTNLSSAVFSEGFTTLGINALSDCPELKEVYFPSTFEVPSEWFYNTDSLTSMNISEHNPNFLVENEVIYSTDGTTLMYYPVYLKYEAYTIPDTVTDIYYHAFGSNPNVSNISIPDSLTVGQLERFYDLENLSQLTTYFNGGTIEVDSVDGVLYNADHTMLISYPQNKPDETYTPLSTTLTIGRLAFANTNNLRGIVLNNGLESIEELSFTNSDLLETVDFSDSLTSIGVKAFYDCDNITLLELALGIEVINESAFSEMDNLESLILNEGLLQIRSYVLRNSNKVVSVSIPSTVTSIFDQAFYDALGLEYFEVAVGSAHFTTIEGVLFNAAETYLVSYPANKPDTLFIIPDGVTVMGTDFGHNQNLETIYFPSSIWIYSSLTECLNLKTVVFKNNVALTWTEMPEPSFNEHIEGFVIYIPAEYAAHYDAGGFDYYTDYIIYY